MVRMKGIEPPRLAALDPKSSASTNFATSANSPSLNGAANILFFNQIQFFYGKSKLVLRKNKPKQKKWQYLDFFVHQRPTFIVILSQCLKEII